MKDGTASAARQIRDPSQDRSGQGRVVDSMAGDITRQAIIAVWLCIPIAPAAADTVTLRYGQIPSTVRSVSALYLSIAQQKGFFTREEVKLDLIPIAGGTDKMIAALDQGTIDVTQTATPYLIRSVLSGSDAVAIAGDQPRLQPDRETADPAFCRTQGQDARSLATRRYDFDLHAQAA